MSQTDTYYSTSSASFLSKRKKRVSTVTDKSGDTGKSSRRGLFGLKSKSRESASSSSSMGLSDTNESGSVHSRNFATPQPVSDDYVSTANDNCAAPIRSSDGYIIIDRGKGSPSQDSFASSKDTIFGVHSDQEQEQDQKEEDDDESFQKYLADQAEITHLRMMTSEIRGKNDVSIYTEECDYKDTGRHDYNRRNEERLEHVRKILNGTKSFNS
ncbi:hypothetical protein L486_04444 [Kwoniella mangroviensis CBS 10435]|uniref:Uncharacterized protein n=1 Tax=Kwoniella mangroviensis CBS 10435 TaxID=1331196 RepID=A0A1B9ISA4_9TREE|nr:hypothetical protein L486_04444 [Kwoniella mangroviensis CBS 10435]OCF78421.1 hypothetical protein I204_00361 [Kwoniella mangroviensis CBS 8886]